MCIEQRNDEKKKEKKKKTTTIAPVTYTTVQLKQLHMQTTTLATEIQNFNLRVREHRLQLTENNRAAITL